MSRTIDDNKPDDGAGAAHGSESRFRRWSRRKHEARAAARRDEVVPASTPGVEADADSAHRERILTDADMPPIETLDEHSDYSVFMSPGVSDSLRRAALRRLFGSPQLNQLCELEGEFFDARGYVPLGNIVTYEMRAAAERELAKAKESAKQKLGRRKIEDSETTDAKRVEVEAPPGESDGSSAVAGTESATASDNENLFSEKGTT